MILFFHILIAISSMLYATYLYSSPDDAKFKVTYALVGLTLASGTYLVLDNGSHLLQACMSGLLYLGLVSVALILARRKYVKQPND